MGDSGFPNNNNREGLKLQHCVINRFLFPDVEAPAQVFVVVSLTEVNKGHHLKSVNTSSSNVEERWFMKTAAAFWLHCERKH